MKGQKRPTAQQQQEKKKQAAKLTEKERQLLLQKQRQARERQRQLLAAQLAQEEEAAAKQRQTEAQRSPAPAVPLGEREGEGAKARAGEGRAAEGTRRPVAAVTPGEPSAPAPAEKESGGDEAPSAAQQQARARAADARFARHVRETSLRFSAYKDLVVFASTVLLWQRPLVLAGTCVVTHVVLWYTAVLLAKVRLLQLACYLLIAAVCGSSALHYLGITRARVWELVPKAHSRGALEPLMSYEDVICAYCAVYRAVFEKVDALITYRDQALPFFTLQAVIVLVGLTYVASMFSGFFLLYVTVFAALLAPGLFFHEAITRGAKALSPHIKTISSQVDMAVGNVIQKKRRSQIADAARKSLSEPFSFVRALAGESEGQEPAANAAAHRAAPQPALTPQQIQQQQLQQQILMQQRQMAALLQQQQQLAMANPQGQQQQATQPMQQPVPVSTVPRVDSAPTVDPYAHATVPAQRSQSSTQKKVF
eukprot:CAMPEP_0114614860 /NCGR_PEP_ID=MMETSP0168-20121206/5870_1 /TAXON_ID=95228 ORGANISM="Vannella sp., Strain DIVA3 517/6/12" /NCGR_SAMPLE_ID=MMETSP0168 /ASSEMBLY_ACC=CAM_ASM_000044 /LENGTH=480 /DNA_ID=CAMNT_0001825919 /DNA_START=129 /DNA_END=1571 /DNA_ORIENTATION=-